ncbi:MAG: MoaD/ThiS family protein [Bacteroidetes bacterium]|nr:MoaD/ThiS family protein [Bacteroidota bacterium]
MPLFQIQLFSVLQSKFKTSSIEVEGPEGITVAELLDSACEQYPLIVPYRNVMRLAVNHQYAPDSQILQDLDEIAIITPVSGG